MAAVVFLLALVVPAHLSGSGASAAFPHMVSPRAASFAGGTAGARRGHAPRIAISARITSLSGGRRKRGLTSCIATVTLHVTVLTARHAAVPHGAVLLYQPPAGTQVLPASAPRKQRAAVKGKQRVVKHAHIKTTKSPTTTTRSTARRAASSSLARFALAAPRHGRTGVTIKLSVHTISVRVRARHGRSQSREMVKIGGVLRVMRGRVTLARLVPRLSAAVSCTTARTAIRHRAPAAGSGAPVSSGRQAAPATVSISNFAFSPAAITVIQGTRVTWTNMDAVAHTVTAKDGSWGSGTLAHGASYSHVFSAAGTYAYFCSIHPFMTGTVTVVAPSPTSTPAPGGAATAPSATAAAATSTPTAQPATATPTAANPAAPSSTPGPAVMVAIANFAFSPPAITVAPGTTVVWTNQDTAAHTVTADDGSWASGTLNQGATYSRTFTTVGTYTYHCAIHPFMHGTITVMAAGAPTFTPTSIPIPSDTPTATPVPPSNTPTDTTVPPTNTPTATPTNTPTATATATPSGPTPTGTPPTATATPSPRPPTATATPTPVPPTATPTVTVTPTPATVVIANFAFTASTITIKSGTTVTWMDEETETTEPHTVTADDGSWTSPLLHKGDSYSHTFTTAGTVMYHCAIHPFMTGTVIVTP